MSRASELHAKITARAAEISERSVQKTVLRLSDETAEKEKDKKKKEKEQKAGVASPDDKKKRRLKIKGNELTALAERIDLDALPDDGPDSLRSLVEELIDYARRLEAEQE